jgi:hypothetical protein
LNERRYIAQIRQLKNLLRNKPEIQAEVADKLTDLLLESEQFKKSQAEKLPGMGFEPVEFLKREIPLVVPRSKHFKD